MTFSPNRNALVADTDITPHRPAAESGDNCEGTQAKQTVQVGPTTIINPVNVPSMLAEQARELYSKNIMHLLQQIIIKDKGLAPSALRQDDRLTLPKKG